MNILPFGLLAVLLGTSAFASDKGCVITDTSCPCSVKASSGTCMRHQGGNTCIMGDCNEGYKCDCFGFEECSRNRCSIFTTDANTIPDSKTPFPCHSTPDAGVCTIVRDFLDTPDAADNAKAEATASVKETTMELADNSDDVKEVLQDEIAVVQIIEELDRFAEEVSEDERTEVDEEVKQVVQAAQEVQEVSTQLNNGLAEAVDANLQAGYFQRRCRRRRAEEERKKKEVEIEEAKPESEEKRRRCGVLRAEIGDLEKDRRKAAKLAGTWTKKAQKAKGGCQQLRNKGKDIRRRCKESRMRCDKSSQKILRGVRARPRGV